ncbi:hypothetical protein FKM82_014238 [Ascaphus truei]
MFITVLYGDNEEILFNSHCKVQLLLESIKNSCHYENEGSQGSAEVVFTPLLNDDGIVNAKFLAKLGNWGESKVSSRKLKSKRSNRKSTVVITTPPEAGKLSTSPRRRAVKA